MFIMFVFVANLIFAQTQRCQTMEYLQDKINKNPSLKKVMEDDNVKTLFNIVVVLLIFIKISSIIM